MVDDVLITNLETNEQILIASDKFILERVNWGTAQGAHKTTKFVSQIGVVITSSTIDMRDIEVIGWIHSDTGNQTEMNQLRRQISRLINPLHKHTIEANGYKIYFKPITTVKFSSDWRTHNETLCNFIINGTCEDPMFTTASSQVVEMAGYTRNFHLPFNVGTGQAGWADKVVVSYRYSTVSTAIENIGDVECGMRVEFVSKNGSVVNPSLTNMVTGEFIKINKTLEIGEKIVVDTNVRTMGVTLYDDTLPNGYQDGFVYFDLSSSFIQLQPGVHIYRYDADSNLTELEVNIFFDPRFLEVF